MNRVISVFAVVFAIVLGASAISPGAVAQDDMDEMANHPIVGTWIFDSDIDDPANSTSVITFLHNGAVLDVNEEAVDLGVWEPTGENTLAITMRSTFSEDTMNVIIFFIRAEGEVAADGNTFTATYTIEVINPDGEEFGEYGPGQAEGIRLAVEPMGEPVGTIEEMSGAGGGDGDDLEMPQLFPETCGVIAEGLAEPRYVAIGEDGTVYVTEAGSGGEEMIEVAPPMEEGDEAAEDGEMEPLFRGNTGQITAASRFHQALRPARLSVEGIVGRLATLRQMW